MDLLTRPRTAKIETENPMIGQNRVSEWILQLESGARQGRNRATSDCNSLRVAG